AAAVVDDRRIGPGSWHASGPMLRQAHIIGTRSAGSRKKRAKKNGGREGFPRLAAVCWAGGQLEAPGGTLTERCMFSYDGIISPEDVGDKVGRFFLPEFRQAPVHNLTKSKFR